MSDQKRVFVTGATGYIARQFLPGLVDRYDCLFTDVKKTDRNGKAVPYPVELLDLLDSGVDAVAERMTGYDVVVHAAAGPFHTWERELQNLLMTRTLLQAAFDAGVSRVVLTSSNHAADFYESHIHAGLMDRVGPDTYPLSHNVYGWAKIAYESLAFVYAAGEMGRKMGIVAIRIGAPRPIRGEKYRGKFTQFNRDLGAYLSERDMQQLYQKSIDAPSIDNEFGVPFQVFYGISDNRRAFWSIANARKVIGYEPQDDSEIVFADEIRRLWTEPLSEDS